MSYKGKMNIQHDTQVYNKTAHISKRESSTKIIDVEKNTIIIFSVLVLLVV